MSRGRGTRSRQGRTETHDPPCPAAPYACARADPAAAQRGQDRSPSRQGPRPRLAVLAVPDHHPDDADRVARAAVRRRPGQGRRGARPRSRPARPGAAQRRPRGRPDRPRRRDLHRRPLRRPRLRHPLPRGPPPGDRAGGDHELALRHRAARRPDPGLPALRRRHPSWPARHRFGRRRVARGPRRGRHRGGRHRPARRPPLRDVRRLLAAGRVPGPPRRDRARAPRVGRQAVGREPLQQGDQGPHRPRAARGRRQPPHAQGARRHPHPARLDRRDGRAHRQGHPARRGGHATSSAAGSRRSPRAGPSRTAPACRRRSSAPAPGSPRRTGRRCARPAPWRARGR